MSLRIASSDSADDLTVSEVVALLIGQLGVERQLGHADDAVHRRADLVAHVGQELALRAAALPSPCRARPPGRCSSRAAPRCAPRRSARALPGVRSSLPIALLDLAEHLVEAVDQLADLVVARLFGARLEALVASHRARDGGQLQEGARDQALQAARKHERHQAADDADAQQHDAELSGAQPQLGDVGLDVQDPNGLAMPELDRPVDHEDEALPVEGRRLTDRGRRRRPGSGDAAGVAVVAREASGRPAAGSPPR